MEPIQFTDRADAGRRLGAEIAQRMIGDPILLALPRGGVPVAAEIARRLAALLDVLVVRKVGAPMQPELAIAAVAEGTPAHVVLNPPVLRHLGLDLDDIAEDIARESREVARRAALFREGRPRLSASGRDAIIVDDGMATGCTMRAAIEAVKQDAPRSIGVAVPVAPPDELPSVEKLADWVVCLSAPASFVAVGAHYRSFPQLADAEVVATLRAWRGARHLHGPPDTHADLKK